MYGHWAKMSTKYSLPHPPPLCCYGLAHVNTVRVCYDFIPSKPVTAVYDEPPFYDEGEKLVYKQSIK